MLGRLNDEVIGWLAFYNRKRMPSTLGYTSPMAFEENGSEGPTVRNRTVRNRIFSQISSSTCARRWIGHQKLNSAAIMREIMAGMWDFPCFGPARAHLSRSKRAPIAGGHNAGNTDAGSEAALACRVPEQPAVRTLSLTGSRFQSPCWLLDLTFERSTAAREPVPG
jgi:hypothetical protein